MENNHEDSLLSVVEDFSPPLSPTPADFTDELDKDEMEEGDDHDEVVSAVRPYMFKSRCEADSAAGEGETQAHPHLESVSLDAKLAYAPECRRSNFFIVFQEMTDSETSLTIPALLGQILVYR